MRSEENCRGNIEREMKKGLKGDARIVRRRCRFFWQSFFNRCFLDGGREVRLYEKKKEINNDDD